MYLGLFKSIPSLTDPKISIFDETNALNGLNLPLSQAHLFDRNRAIIELATMEFSMVGRVELLKLTEASEEKVGQITDHRLAFAVVLHDQLLQPGHSAVEFKRYLHRFMKVFSRIETLAGSVSCWGSTMKFHPAPRQNG